MLSSVPDVVSESEIEASDSEMIDSDSDSTLAFELGKRASSFTISVVAVGSLLSVLHLFYPSL